MSETMEPDAPEGVPAEGVSSDTENTDVQGAETESPAVEETPADDAGAEPPKPQSKGVQKRIDELTARAYQAERRADEALAILRAQVQGNPAQQQQQPQGSASLPPDIAQHVGPAPKPDDFPAGEFDPKYAVALAKHEMRMEQAQAVAHQREMQKQAYQRQVVEQFQQGMAKIVASNPDAPKTIEALSYRIPPNAANFLAQVDPAVAYYIARNPEAEESIRKAGSDVAVLRTIGRIEARLEAARAAPPQPTAAPAPPPRAAKGTASAARTIYDAKDFEEYAKLRGF